MNILSELEQELNKEGFEVRGHYPLIKVSFYTLEINTDDNNVILWYGPQQYKLTTVELNPQQIAHQLKIINNYITHTQTTPSEFMNNLYKSCTKQKTPINTVFKNYKQITSNKDYDKVLFSYDLSTLTKRIHNNKELTLVTATRAYTTKQSDFIWIPPGNYISHITFNEVRQ